MFECHLMLYLNTVSQAQVELINEQGSYWLRCECNYRDQTDWDYRDQIDWSVTVITGIKLRSYRNYRDQTVITGNRLTEAWLWLQGSKWLRSDCNNRNLTEEWNHYRDQTDWGVTVSTGIRLAEEWLWVQGSDWLRSDCDYRDQNYWGVAIITGIRLTDEWLWLQGSDWLRSDCDYRDQTDCDYRDQTDWGVPVITGIRLTEVWLWLQGSKWLRSGYYYKDQTDWGMTLFTAYLQRGAPAKTYHQHEAPAETGCGWFWAGAVARAAGRSSQCHGCRLGLSGSFVSPAHPPHWSSEGSSPDLQRCRYNHRYWQIGVSGQFDFQRVISYM